MYELVSNNTSVEWRTAETGLSQPIQAVHLGRRPNVRDMPAGFRDSAEEIVADAEIIIGVKQTSYGATGVYARSLSAGYTVESLNPDASSPITIWRGSNTANVEINTDDGRMGEIGRGARADTVFGRSGTRSGIIRVTSPDGRQRYYLVGANFDGREDDWWVTGEILEVELDTQAQLTSGAVLALLSPERNQGEGGMAGAELNNASEKTPVDNAILRDLRRAFENGTAGTHILYANDEAVRTASLFAPLTLNLLIELARTQPELFAGTEAMVDNLGARARLINNSAPGTFGFLTHMNDANSARVAYLDAIREIFEWHQPHSDNCHTFTLFTEQAFAILERVVANGDTHLLQGSDVEQQVTEVVTSERTSAQAAQHRREGLLNGTVLDPNSLPDNVEILATDAANQVAFTVNRQQPLLSEDQTYRAFYANTRTDAVSWGTETWNNPTLLMIEVEGIRYAVTYGYRGLPISGIPGHQYQVLQILDETPDERYGILVDEAGFSFRRVSLYSSELTATSYDLKDARKRDRHGYYSNDAKIGVTIFLATTGELVISSDGPEVKVVAPTGIARSVAA